MFGVEKYNNTSDKFDFFKKKTKKSKNLILVTAKPIIFTICLLAVFGSSFTGVKVANQIYGNQENKENQISAFEALENLKSDIHAGSQTKIVESFTQLIKLDTGYASQFTGNILALAFENSVNGNKNQFKIDDNTLNQLLQIYNENWDYGINKEEQKYKLKAKLNNYLIQDINPALGTLDATEHQRLSVEAMHYNLNHLPEFKKYLKNLNEAKKANKSSKDIKKPSDAAFVAAMNPDP